jgi:serine phosphatase RsbU (regulator of sigma subunit)
MVHLADDERLVALERSTLLGAERDAEFDRITRLAQRLTGADMALVTLLDDRRQFIFSESGLPEPWATRRETPLSHSICRHTVAAGEPVIIEDAREHPLVCDSPAVTELGVGAYAGFPLRSGDGHVLGALCAIGAAPRTWSADDLGALEDLAVTLMSLMALRETTERSARLAGQYAVVAHAARAIGEVHGDAVIFERIADLAVTGGLADMCVVDLLQDGRLEEVAGAPRDPRRAKLHAKRAALLADVGSDHPAWVALSAARTQHLSELPAGPFGEAELALYRRSEVGPALLVPLIFHGAPLGVVSLARRQGAPDFSEEDVAVAEAVAHQVSAAVSAERLLEEHRNVSGLLQRTLLPRELPTIPGLGVATWYEAGDGEMDVGGDFYDVIQRPDGSWLLVIGDVCGRGPAAAAMTGVVRHTLRGLLASESDLPSAVGELNRRLYHETEPAEFVTLAAVGVDLRGESPVVQTTLAGHPAPIVVSGDGAISSLGRPGFALGLYEEAEYRMIDAHLSGGDALVMYTDGLTEAHGSRTQFDHEALAALLASCAGLPAPEILDRVQRGLFAAEGDSVSDDVAVMAAQVSV